MPWNGNGIFEDPPGPQFPAIPDDLIRASDFNFIIRHLVVGLAQALNKDGQSVMAGHLNMGGNRLINLGKAIANGQPVRFEEFNTLEAKVNASQVATEPLVLLSQGII